MKKSKIIVALLLVMILGMSVVLTACPSNADTELADAKAALSTGLEGYKAWLLENNVYTNANISILNALLISGKSDIEEATSIDAAQKAFEDSKALMDLVDPDPVPSAIKKGSNDLDKHFAQLKSANSYTAANLTILEQRLASAKAELATATDILEVHAILAAGKNAMSQVAGEKKASMSYNIHTAVSPSDWNELTYRDANDTQIMSYLSSSFFEYNFAYDAQDNIIDGKFEIDFSAATALEDVSQSVAAKWGIGEKETGRAWKITIRDDLKWDDGTQIKAADFIYSMKEQLNPLFKNFRADSYYKGANILVNAWDYVFQGSAGKWPANMVHSAYSESLDDKLIFALGRNADGNINFRDGFFGATSTRTAEQVATYFVGYFADYDITLNAATLAEMEGKTLKEIKANATWKAEWENLILGFNAEMADYGAGYDCQIAEIAMTLFDGALPSTNFEDVGIFVGDTEYEVVVVLQNSLQLLDTDGSLSYRAAYNFSGLPLVKQDLYEACKVAPKVQGGLWTTTYNSSVDTSASWGPYNLTSFQTGKEYVLTRNENWFGYGAEQYEGQYQTTRIVCETIAEWNTAWLKFLAGELDSVAINVTIAADYKNSSRAFFTPTDFVNSIQLQSSYEALEARQSEGINKTILTYKNFRKAMSLAVNRAEYARICTTSHKAGFGLFGPMHYNDVANGGVYRDTEIAMRTLLTVYGFVEQANGTWTDASQIVYADMDEAYNAITGFDLVLAKQLLVEAYEEALADGEILATDKIELAMGTSEITTNTQRNFDFLVSCFDELTKGTVLEGRLVFKLEAWGSTWATSFIDDGAYDIATGGWSGAAWDPGYFLLAYIGPGVMYSSGWDTEKEMLTLTMPGYNQDRPITMGLLDWYDALNGTAVEYIHEEGEEKQVFNWGSGKVSEDVRLIVIAAIEKVVLDMSYSVPITYEYTASLLSYKVDYPTYTYNTFMAYGGVRYRTFNYNDTAWAQYLSQNLVGGSLDYKK